MRLSLVLAFLFCCCILLCGSASGASLRSKGRNMGRQGRQLGVGAGLGYGGQLAGLQSQLQGISSGYGYGYNNAVGLGGLGMNNGYGLALPLGGLIG
ncbi:pupal cuticle protein Edg-91-like [Paramacrobiotus metropolitanus]|uniref:pupal cuticle protein Edg-91-like n=1 Tax=Paramacrobiotus metropolitanus TaxID=2943436 RepID=UPI0024463BE8|nr:pupal cuticle protein Edg-91-like [Paramacrobiotus metropolitanus]